MRNSEVSFASDNRYGVKHQALWMKILRKLIFCIVLVTFCFISPIQVHAVNEGGTCKKAGLTTISGASTLICRKVGKSLRWTPRAARTSRAPGPVFGFSASYSNLLGISLWWSPPLDRGTSPITGYRLEFHTLSTPWLSLPSNLSATLTSTVVRNSELSGYTLRFRIAPVNSFGVGTFTESVWVYYPPSSDGGTASTTSPSPQTSITSSTSTTTIPRTTTTQLQTTTSVTSRTVSQSNAVKTAASYLRSSSFSRTGLIRQLQFEGFSLDDSTYGVDAQNADWNAQAVKTAASYLRSSSFSRTGLIKQLQFEGFSNSEATYGVDAQNADWNAQAAKTAASYLKISSFSRSGLIDQLVFEGFTSAEAEYGVSTTGL